MHRNSKHNGYYFNVSYYFLCAKVYFLVDIWVLFLVQMGTYFYCANILFLFIYF